MVYDGLILVHSWLRWTVVIAGLYAAATAASGVITTRPWTPRDGTAHRAFLIVLDVQFLVGFILYAVVSPVVAAAMADVPGAMRDPMLRYWLVEHTLPIVIAVGLVHLGVAKARRLASVVSHRHVLLHLVVALILIAASTPWPFMTQGRPWFRLW